MGGTAPKGGMQTTVKKVSNGARLMDAVLCLVFAWCAFNSTGGWQIFWIASSVFCAVTAITSPLDKLPGLIQRVLGVRKV